MEFRANATVCAVLLTLLLLSPYGGGGGAGVGVGVAEARVCTGKSQHHSFPCLSDHHCTHDCLQEKGGGWTAGYCHFRICTCQKSC